MIEAEAVKDDGGGETSLGRRTVVDWRGVEIGRVGNDLGAIDEGVGGTGGDC